MTKIIHIDMDCFYAAIEVRDRPELINRPVAVGGSAEERSVLCTCNYVARKLGVRSAMSTAMAKRLCPDLVVLPVAMAKYRDTALAIRKIFFDYTELVEPLSLDEAYLDVTACEKHDNRAVRIAREIRQRIFTELQLTASAGIAPNKFLAKVASDWKKPNGQYVILPEAVAAFVKTLAIEKIFGVGKVTAAKMHAMNLVTCADLQLLSQETLVERFGRFGGRLYFLCRGQDDRKVEPQRERKSVSIEHTFLQDLPSLAACLQRLPSLYADLKQRLKKHAERKIHKQFIKIKFYDFEQTTVECMTTECVYSYFVSLLESGYARQKKPIRLLGVGVGFRATEECLQVELDL